MALWRDLASWRGPTANQGGAMVEHRGLVIHIAEGYYEGTISYQRNPAVDVSSHFVVSDGAKGQGADGAIAQVVDTDVTAWTQRAGNGHWLSAEFAGFTPQPLTSAQVESCARLLAKAHRVYGVPLQVATSPDGRGLGHHSMGSHPGFPDDWGHSDCPGPAIIAQKPAIVARAQQIIIDGGNMTIIDMVGTKLSSGMSLNDAITRILGRLPADLEAKFAEVLTAAHNDAETDASISDAAAAKIAAALVAVLPTDVSGLSAAEIAKAVNDDEAARLQS